MNAADHTLSRRRFFQCLGAGGALLVTSSAGLLAACGDYAPFEGAAYEPWSYPGDEAAPERIAVAAAILAASPHNTQPWLFAVTPTSIEVVADARKSLGAMDPLSREMYIGLGCAIENLVLSALAHGRDASVQWLPDPARPSVVARITLTPTAPRPSPLHDAIPNRHTNRGPYLEAAPPPSLEQALRAQIDDPQVSLTFVAGAAEKASFREATVAATRAIVADDAMNEASHAWWRQTRDDIEQHRDGLTLDATVDPGTSTLGKLTGKPSAAKAGEYWIANTEGAQTTGFAFCVLSTETRDDREQQLRCGRIFQRMHLWAASQGLSVQPLNQMAERQDREQQLGLPPDFGPRLAALCRQGVSSAQMLFRVGVAWDAPGKSPRRPLAWVLQP